MKSLFVPIDYQRHTDSVVQCAGSLANQFGAEIILFHCFQLPLVSAETSYTQYPIEQLYEDNLIALDNIKHKLLDTEENKIEVRSLVKPGFPGASILEEAKQNNCDLILMTSSQKSKLGEIFIGSTSVYVARHSKIPVLSIPENFSYKFIKRILISISPQTIFHEHYLYAIKQFRESYKAQTELMSIFSKEEENKKNNLDEWRKALNISTECVHYFKREKGHVSDSIKNTATFGDADLLITFPQKHSLLEKVFQENITKELVLHSSRPLLTINE